MENGSQNCFIVNAQIFRHGYIIVLTGNSITKPNCS